MPEKFGACRRLLERIVAEHGERLFAKPFLLDSSAWVGARLAEVLPLPAAARQKLLELDDSRQRLEILQRLLVESALAPSRFRPVLSSSVRTGAGTAARTASATSSQIRPGASARGSILRTLQRIGWMFSRKCVKPCSITGIRCALAISHGQILPAEGPDLRPKDPPEKPRGRPRCPCSGAARAVPSPGAAARARSNA